MSNEKSTPKKTVERVALTSETMTLLQSWADQLRGQFKGMKVRLQDVVEWKLNQSSAELTHKELTDFKNRYWDEIAYAAWAVREMKKARERGENIGLDHFFTTPSSAKSSRKTPSEKTARNTEDCELSGSEVTDVTKE